MLFSLFNDKSSKSKIMSYYHEFTDVEKVMIDRNYLWNDEDYPTFYWKTIAGIHYIIKKKDMCKIDSLYASNDTLNDITRIRSSSECEKYKIRSIYDIYVNFSIAYTPFKQNNIDSKLKKLCYPVEFLTSIKDKLIIFVKDFANNEKLHPIEKELCCHVSFLCSINFMSFYESLLAYKYEHLNYVVEQPSYDLLYYESKLFREEIIKDVNRDPRHVVNEIIYKISKHHHQRIMVSLKLMLLGNYMIRHDDLIHMLRFCRHFFNPDVAEHYINDILIMMKYRNISPAIVMIFDKTLAYTYSLIERTTEYIVEHSTNIDISCLPIFETNYVKIASCCNNITKFRDVIKIIKENNWPNVKECIFNFVKKMMNSGSLKFGDLSDIEPNIKDIVMDHRYDFFASHIKNKRVEFIEISLTEFKDWDLQNIKIIEAVAESCDIEILERIYGYGQHSDDFIQKVVIVCYRKGSTVFADYFIGKYNINDNNIINAVTDSHNVSLVIRFRNTINLTNIDDIIGKTIVNDNFSVFIYLFTTIDHRFINISKLILLSSIHNRKTILNILITGNKTYNDNSFYLNILKKCVSIVTSDILSIFFNRMLYNYNDKNIQLFVLLPIIDKILKTDNRQWLEDNLCLLPIFYLKCRTPTLRYYNYFFNESYISSDEDD